MEKVSLPNYDSFDNPGVAYNDFIYRLEGVINVVAFIKTVRTKNNTSEWFDGEIADKIHTRGKLYKNIQTNKTAC